MPKLLNYATEYSRELANAYPYLSYFPELWAGPNNSKYKPVNAKTVLIPSMDVTGARQVNRDHIDGVFNRNFETEMQAVTMTMDREWDTLVDPMDIQETNMVATIANITKTFNEFQKVPEMDAYMASKVADFATTYGTVDKTTLTKDNILETWDEYLAYVTDNRIPRDRLIAYMTPTVYKALKEAAGITRFIDAVGVRNIDRNVGSLDGVRIREVPTDIMQTVFDFTVGWVKGSNAQTINLLIVDPVSIITPIIYETSMISAPSAQTKGKWLYYERYYYDVFALNRRRNGILANISTPMIGSLEVTSVAGAETNQTIVTVDTQPVLGQKLVYKSAASAQLITYGQALTDWTDLPVDGVITESGSNTVVTVAMVNTTKGNVAVSSGSATIVKKTD